MRPTAVLPEATACHRPRKESGAYQAPPPLPLLQPPPFQAEFMWFSASSGQKRGWPLFRGPKVLQLNSDSFCDHVRIWTDVIGHLWAELGFWLFPEKRWKYSRPGTFGQGANILAGRAGTTAGTVRQRCRPYKLGGLRADPHLRTAWRRDNITWTRALQPDWEGVRSWRFCRARIVRVWAPIFLGAYIFHKARRFQRPPCSYCILWGANILDVAHIFYICADILD